MTPTVLVTDGEQRSALAVVRSLGRAGYQVHVAAAEPERALAPASRFATAGHAVPDPRADPERYAAEVAALAERGSIDLLLPITDASNLALLDLAGELPRTRIPGPRAADFRRISDKRGLLETAAELGIHVPRQLVLENAAAELPLESLTFPLILKTSRSVLSRGGVGTVHLVRDRRDLRACLDDRRAEAYPILIQERVRGPGVGVFLLLWEGRLLAAFSHRRLREKPPWGGVSVYRESIPLDEGLLRRSRRLLDAYGWTGVAMVEYKIDEKTGAPYLMEVNGRFWGSLQLAIDCGVDFPRLLADAALGRAVAPVLSYPAGRRLRWWWGDVDNLLASLRAPDDATRGDRSRGEALRDFLRLWRPGDRSEIARASDPRPFLRETLMWLRSAEAGLARRTRRPQFLSDRQSFEAEEGSR